MKSRFFQILIVDDFEELREFVCLMLHERPEFQVIGQASDGLEGVKQAQDLQPDLILLDIGMPHMNGFEAAKRIRKVAPNSKILFFSQESSDEVVEEALRLGGHGYLYKHDAVELPSALDAVLEDRRFLSSHVKRDAIIEMLPRPHSSSWRVLGTYFEACNCEAICPCRKQGGMQLMTGSTYGFCNFALSWHIVNGTFDGIDLSERFVVMAGSYRDDEPNKPWRVILYLDERSSDKQFAALTNIFLGRAGGTTFVNFGAWIADIYAVRRAAIELDHRPRRWLMRASTLLEVRASRTVPSELPVSCGIPGHDRRGNELLADALRVHDAPLDFHVRGRCGFHSDFDYSSHGRA